MKISNSFIFIFLQVIAWIIFVGLCIEAGGLIVNFFFSIYNPEFVPKLYQKIDLTKIDKRTFYSIYSFLLTLAILKAYLFYILINLMHKMDLSKPFNSFVAGKIADISYYTLSIGLVTYIASEYAKNLFQKGLLTQNLNQFWDDSQAFILMGAVIYIISVIFKKGVEIQNENDLTV